MISLIILNTYIIIKKIGNSNCFKLNLMVFYQTNIWNISYCGIKIFILYVALQYRICIVFQLISGNENICIDLYSKCWITSSSPIRSSQIRLQCLTHCFGHDVKRISFFSFFLSFFPSNWRATKRKTNTTK